MDIEKLKLSLAKAEAAGNKQQVNQLKQKIKAGEASGAKTDPPPKGPHKQGRGSKVGLGDTSLINGSQGYPATLPAVSKLAAQEAGGYNGRKYSSYGYQDPYASQSPALVQISEIGDFEIRGRVAGGGTAVVGEFVVSDWADNLIHDLHGRAAAKHNSITGYNTTGTISASFLTFLNMWSNSYRILAPLKTLSGFAEYNRPLDAVAQNVLALLPTLDAAMARLMTWCVPQAWVDWLDKTCGVFLPIEAGIAPLLVIGTTAAVADQNLITAASVGNLIAQANATNFSVINGLPQADLANITRVLANLYEAPPNLNTRPAHRGMQEYHMMYSRGIIHARTATSDAAPAITGSVTGTLIPLYIWGELATLDPLWTSAARPVFAYSDNGNLPVNNNSYGMSQLSRGTATTGSAIFTYDNTATFVNRSIGELFDAATTHSMNLGDFTDGDFPWAKPAMRSVSAATQLSTDNRGLTHWNRIYVPFTDMMNSATSLFRTIWTPGWDVK